VTSPEVSTIHIAVSSSATPNNLTTDWTFLAGTSFTVLGGATTWADYPGIGTDSGSLFITTNQFTFASNSYRGLKIRVFDKAALLAGVYGFVDINFDAASTTDLGTTMPAHVYGTTTSGGFYLISRAASTSYRLFHITGAPAAPVATTSTFAWSSGAFPSDTGADQCTVANPDISTLSSRVMTALYRAGHIWLSLTADPDNDGQTEVVWQDIMPNAWPAGTPSVVQSGFINGTAPDSWTYMPSINVSAAGDAAINYTQSSTTECATMYYVTRLSTASPGTFGAPVLAKSSVGFYDSFVPDNIDRWGDYSATVVDPTDDCFWIANEFVFSSGADTSEWGTFIANLCTRITDCNNNGVQDNQEILPSRVFVDASATGASDGTSWADAFVSLRDAISFAVCANFVVTEIWVANGTYMPDGGYTSASGSHVAGSGDRTATFQLVNGVSIYGGFEGGDSVSVPGGETSLTQRPRDSNSSTIDPLTDSILSGDIDNDAILDNENSFHVCTGSGTDVTAVLDGFSITFGNANVAGNDVGGGMNNNGSSTVTNCAFIGNKANFGGGMSNNTSSPTLINCTFSGNTASFAGGGMSNDAASNPTMVNCAFIGNTAGGGGGMYNEASLPTLTNCTFSGNTASVGGGMSNNASAPTLANCILWGDSPNEITNNTSTPAISYSDVAGSGGSAAWDAMLGTDGGGNIAADPLFMDADLRLQGTSPSIDAGDNTALGLAGILTDLDSQPRFEDMIAIVDTGNGSAPIVDMGAYEAFADCNNNGISDTTDIANGAPDLNGNGIPDTCDIKSPLALTGEPGFSKDRYLSIDPTTNGTALVATRVTRVGGVAKYVDCTSLTNLGADGWYAVLIDGPLPAAGNTTYYCDLSGVTTGLHMRGCSIVPGNTYDVDMTTNGSAFSLALSVPTTPPQFSAGRQFGDVVGGLIGGVWTAPDGLVTANDIVAVVQKFSAAPSAPIIARVNNAGVVPNTIVSAAGDVLRAVSAFAAADFGNGVTNCLTGTCVPSCP